MFASDQKFETFNYSLFHPLFFSGREESKMEGEGSENRQWDELIPDALGVIFKKLSLEDKLRVIPRMCKTWGKVVEEPYCWQEIDIHEWSTNRQPDKLDRMLRLLITRSSGSLRKLLVSSVKDDHTFSFIAENAGSLESLTLRRSEISDSVIEELASKFSKLTSLDLSYCWRISASALEAIGKSCKLLTSLRWNMHPFASSYKVSHADEARAIARTMPKLKHLELAFLRIDNEVVLEIVSGCLELELLDLRGCWDVLLGKKTIKKRLPNVEVIGPEMAMEDFQKEDSDFSDYGYMDYISDDDSFDGMWDEDIVVSVFDANYLDECGWPTSPW